MEWKNQNILEIIYFCKDTRSPSGGDFDCLPTLEEIVKAMIDILTVYEITHFSVESLLELFQILEVRSLRTGKLLTLSTNKIKKILEKIKNSNGIEQNQNGEYHIIQKSKKFQEYYNKIISYGYKKGYLKR